MPVIDVKSDCLSRVDGGELFDKVVSIGQYDEPTAKLISYQMVCAVKVRRADSRTLTRNILF